MNASTAPPPPPRPPPASPSTPSAVRSVRDPSAWLRSRFEIDHGHRGHVNRPMEGLRGFAVFLVFLVHYTTLVAPWISSDAATLQLAAAIHTIGNAGVDLFFVLSGYLIYGSLIARPQSFAPYMRRRVRRIYPTFITVFAIYVLLSIAAPIESKIPHTASGAAVYLIANLLLLPGVLPIEPMITVAWSLSYELFYYLAMPLLITMLGLRVRSARWRVGFFLAIAAVIVFVGTTVGGPVRLVMFIVGVLLFEARSSAGWTATAPVATSLMAIGLLSALLPTTGPAGFASKIVLLGAGCFVFFRSCFHGPTSGLGHVFSWTPLRWFGNMSYSYYLLHGLALKAGFMALGRVLPPSHQGLAAFTVLMPPMFVLSLLASAVLFLVVERPFSLVARSRRP